VTAIVLAGHGSLVSPETGGLVRRAADLLREWGVADEATSAFWKERPSFSSVADSLESNKIIVVPVFAARGWYVDVVLPRELAKGRKDVEYAITPPIGEHPRMAELIEEAARSGVAKRNRDEAAIVVVGHGTSKHSGSRDTTIAAVDKLRAKQIAAEVNAAFLDDEPTICDAVETCRSPHLVVVPNFIAQGEHASEDVPAAVSEASAKRTIRTRSLQYIPPKLTAEELAKIAWELVRRSGAGASMPDLG
jgi:sirohydrochlorin cobaltochelatase